MISALLKDSVPVNFSVGCHFYKRDPALKMKKCQFFSSGISFVYDMKNAGQHNHLVYCITIKISIMSIIKRNGNHSQSFPALFDDLFSRELFNWGNNNFSSTSTTVPSVNIRETADNYEVEVAAPGMEKKDFSIRLDGSLLTISSVKEQQQENKQENYTRKEFSYQSFQRSFELPKNVVDEDNINARYENGLLRLTIPKKEEAKQKEPRMIEIA